MALTAKDKFYCHYVKSKYNQLFCNFIVSFYELITTDYNEFNGVMSCILNVNVYQYEQLKPKPCFKPSKVILKYKKCIMAIQTICQKTPNIK